jgi:putative multicomponent Na+:H+ antiporter subunit B
MNDSYIYVITALLPLSALMLILQANPYHALVVQGIQGAVATLVFAVLGAADVALTQALMGTLLAITLYAIAVRSSLVMRLGVIEEGVIKTNDESLPDSQAVSIAIPQDCGHFEQLMDDLRTIFHKHYMRVEVVPYTNTQALHRALIDKEVHAICSRQSRVEQDDSNYLLDADAKQPYHTETRVRRLYEIMQAELSSPATSLSYVSTPDSGGEHK